MSALPDLSVILVTPAGYETLRRTMAALRAQTIVSRIEVVIISPVDANVAVPEEDTRALHSVVVVEHAADRHLAGARAEAVRHCRAPVVALGEDHAFPEPGWGEALVARHGDGYAAVGVVMTNGNPRTAISWASFLLAYGAYAPPAPTGEVGTLPGYNGSFRRDLLLAHQHELPVLLAAPTVLHWELRDAGHRLYLDPDARIEHVNTSKFRVWLTIAFHSARLFSGVWSRNWSPGRRAYFTLLSPWIALKRLRSFVRDARRQDQPRPSLLVLVPLQSLGLAFVMAGYVMGFVTGPGNSSRYEWHYELDRFQHLTRADRKALS